MVGTVLDGLPSGDHIAVIIKIVGLIFGDYKVICYIAAVISAEAVSLPFADRVFYGKSSVLCGKLQMFGPIAACQLFL